MKAPLSVMPAKAGIHVSHDMRCRSWIETWTSDTQIEVIHAPGMDKGLPGAIPTSIAFHSSAGVTVEFGAKDLARA